MTDADGARAFSDCDATCVASDGCRSQRTQCKTVIKGKIKGTQASWPSPQACKRGLDTDISVYIAFSSYESSSAGSSYANSYGASQSSSSPVSWCWACCVRCFLEILSYVHEMILPSSIISFFQTLEASPSEAHSETQVRLLQALVQRS